MTRSNSDAFIVDVHIKGKVAELLATAFYLKQNLCRQNKNHL